MVITQRWKSFCYLSWYATCSSTPKMNMQSPIVVKLLFIQRDVSTVGLTLMIGLMRNDCDHWRKNLMMITDKIPNVQKIALLAFRRTEIWVVWRPYCLFPQCKAILELEGWWFQETGECHNLFQETGEYHNLFQETGECHIMLVIFVKENLFRMNIEMKDGTESETRSFTLRKDTSLGRD